MRIRTLLLTGMAILLATGCDKAKNTVKIGHVAPLSGNQAHLGKDNENGAKMAIDELNAAGFVIGGKKMTFELVSEDDAADPKQGTAAAEKLVDAGVNGVIGHMNSGTTIPASKIYHDAGIPQISPSATNPKYTQQGFNTTFRVVANDSQLGNALAHYAINTLHLKKFAVIDDRTAYGQGVAQEFMRAVKETSPDAEIVAQEYTNDKATDFNAILTSIKAKNPDVVFFGGMDAVAGPMLQQMKQLGLDAKLMGGDGICTESLARLAGAAMADDQVVCAEAGGVDDSRKQPLENFRAAYKQKFGTDVQLYAPYVYDAVMTMADAMAKADSVDPAKYLPVLAKIHHEGVTGTIVFDDKGDLKDAALSLYTYKGGKRTLIAVTH